MERMGIPILWVGLILFASINTTSRGPILVQTGGNTFSRRTFILLMLGGVLLCAGWLQFIARSKYLGYYLPAVAGVAVAGGSFCAVFLLTDLRLHERLVRVRGATVASNELASLGGVLFGSLIGGFLLGLTIDYLRRIASGGTKEE